MSSPTPAPLEHAAVISKPAAVARTRHWLWATLFTTAVLVLALTVLAAADFPRYGEDSYYYRELALGNWARVNQPFSARFLQPVIVHFVSGRLGCTVDPVFCAMALLALTGFLLTMAVLYGRLGISPLLLLPAAFCASSVRTLQLAIMPEQFYTLLLGVFFLLLAGGYELAAAVGLVVLFCERESTILLSASIFGVLWWTRRLLEPTQFRRSFLLPAAATLVGVLISRQVSSHAAGNIHHINSFVYLLVKAPYNFLKNVLGLEIWTNTLAELDPKYDCLFKMNLPLGLHLGGIHAIGIAEITPIFPCYWIYGSLSTFGVLLTVIVREVWIARLDQSQKTGLHRLIGPFERVLGPQPAFIQIAAVYGLLSFGLVPLLGSATARYIYYAWPAFWLLGMYLFSTRYWPALRQPRHRTTALALLLVHLALVWPIPSTWFGAWVQPSAFVSVINAALLQVIAWNLLGRVQSTQPVAAAAVPDTISRVALS